SWAVDAGLQLIHLGGHVGLERLPLAVGAVRCLGRLVSNRRPRGISLRLGGGDARLDLLTRLFARGIKRRFQLSDPSLQRIHLLRQRHGTSESSTGPSATK